MATLRALFGGWCLLLASACAGPIALSKDFVVLAEHRGERDYRAVTGDDARVWLRQFEDRNRGDLAFWRKALEYDFVEQRGYDLVAQGEAVDASGQRGHWFQCHANVRGERIGYLVAVWVRGRQITVVEFTARAAVFEARLGEVKQALRTVDV